MKTAGEVRALDAQGIDPFDYLVVPRVLGMMVSTFALTIAFILVSLGSGYACARLAGVRVGGPLDFADNITRAIGPADLFNVVAKGTFPALIWGGICCVEGLSVESPGEIPRAASRSLQRSVVALFVIFAAISVLTYT
jgi:phospholipid/cholesterol/gamma-HCH transport system permease protein